MTVQSGGSLWGRLLGNSVYDRVMTFAGKSTKRRLLFLATLPALWILFASFGPIFQMGRVSFLTQYPPSIGEDAHFTIDNWLLFFRDPIYVNLLLRTIVFAATVTAITLVVAYPVAYFIARHVRRDRRIGFLLVLLVPFWAGEIVRTFAVMLLLGNNGFINNVLKALQLTTQPIQIMYSPFSLGFGVVYLTALYMLLPLYAALERLPPSYFEAAADLGAGPWTRLWRVTIPLSREGIASGCTLVFLISTGFYATPLLLGGPNITLFAETIGRFFHVAGDQWPVGAAFATIMFLTTLSLAGIFLRLMRGPSRVRRQ